MSRQGRLTRLLELLVRSDDFGRLAADAGYSSAGDAEVELLALAPHADAGPGGGAASVSKADGGGSWDGKPVSRMTVHTDGAARGNPGPAAAAAVVYDTSGREIYSRALVLGKATNNEAEYRGLILGLELAEMLGGEEITVRMDSELVVRQMKGEYKIKKDHLRSLARTAMDKASKFRKVEYEHVPRSENSAADGLAARALDGGE